MAWDRCDGFMPGETAPCPCCHAAAAEIERLRAAITEALQCLSLEDNLGFATRELERALEYT